jgi:hypothetical protein
MYKAVACSLSPPASREVFLSLPPQMTDDLCWRYRNVRSNSCCVRSGAAPAIIRRVASCKNTRGRIFCLEKRKKSTSIRRISLLQLTGKCWTSFFKLDKSSWNPDRVEGAATCTLACSFDLIDSNSFSHNVVLASRSQSQTSNWAAYSENSRLNENSDLDSSITTRNVKTKMQRVGYRSVSRVALRKHCPKRESSSTNVQCNYNARGPPPRRVKGAFT